MWLGIFILQPVNTAPIRIAVEEESPRLHYVCEVIFGFILEEGYVVNGDAPPEIWYGKQPPVDFSGLHIPAEGLLHESGLRNVPQDQFERAAFQGMSDFDGLAWAFYHLSDYAAYANYQPDAHGRHRSPGSEGSLLLIEDYAEALTEALDRIRRPGQFSYEITIDVDQPWKHQQKPFAVQAGGFAKSLLQGDWAGLKERWQALAKGKDPFDTDDLIRDWCPADRTTLFWLVDGDHPCDSRFDLRMPAYEDRVRAFAKAGFSMGLHPSYQSWNDPGRLQQEKNLLQSVVGLVESSRQHYLRYRLPGTFRHLLELGIRREYSVGFPQRTGARHRIYRPFPWFDLTTNTRTPLILVPAAVMDRTLLSSLELDPKAALEAIREEMDRVHRAKGHFVLILHNETFSESGEWEGWSTILHKTIALLKEYEGNA